MPVTRISPELQLNAHLSNALNKQYATYGMSGLRSVYTLATQQFITRPRRAPCG